MSDFSAALPGVLLCFSLLQNRQLLYSFEIREKFQQGRYFRDDPGRLQQGAFYIVFLIFLNMYCLKWNNKNCMKFGQYFVNCWFIGF